MYRWGAAFRLIGVGFYIAGCIIGGVLLGLWLDGRFRTQPVLTIVGLLLGIAAAFYGVFKMLLPLLNDKRERR